MMKKDIRMIGIDLDGTLLTRNKELTPASREALVSAIRAGIEVVPVTGRPLSGVPREVLDIPGIRYVITSNGANTYGFDGMFDIDSEDKGALILRAAIEGRLSGAVLRREHLPHEIVRKILAAAPGEHVIREIFIRGVGYHDAPTQTMLEERFSIAPPILAYINRSRKIVAGFETFLEDQTSHVENISLMFPSQEERDECFSRLIKIRGKDNEKILHVLLPWRTDLEITHVLADKWLAVESLAESVGINDGQIMTLGDGDNDRPMLRGAGLSFAMGNAPDFVKETADYITEDNEHDGAAKAIFRILEEAGGSSK